MFRINLKSSIVTLAVIAGVLAVAGPASASSTPLQNSMVSGVVQAPGGQGKVGDDVRGFIESLPDDDGSPLKADSNEVAVEGVTAKTSSLIAEGNLYAGVARTSAGLKSLSGMDSETEFMDYTDDALLD